VKATGSNDSTFGIFGDHKLGDALKEGDEIVVKKNLTLHWGAQSSDRANIVGAGWSDAVGHPLNGSGFTRPVGEREFTID
jgi:hypothetical protein